MPEYEITITICDRCRPGERPPGIDAFAGTPVSGVYRGPFSWAANEGWEERDYGYICPSCIEEEEAEAEQEGDVRGPLYQNQLDFMTKNTEDDNA